MLYLKRLFLLIICAAMLAGSSCANIWDNGKNIVCASVTGIKLCVDKNILISGENSSVVLEAELIGENTELVENPEITYYSNGYRTESSSVVLNERGTYEMYAYFGEFRSNTVTVNVFNEDELFRGTSSRMPVIVIATDAEISTDVTTGTMYVYDNDELNENGAAPQIVTGIEINVRGQSSLGFPKKQYSVHTLNDDGSNNNVELLGMPKENDWVLNGSYADKSLVRNALGHIFFSYVLEYVPRTAFCEVYLCGADGEYDYRGIYTLLEKIKIDKNRVAIDKMSTTSNVGTEITGGYIVSHDHVIEGDNTVETAMGIFTIVSPSPSVITPAQDAYIKKFLVEFADTLVYSKGVERYSEYFDTDTLCGAILMYELVRDVDNFGASAYFFKDRDGLMKYGPSWDFDLSMGRVNFRDAFLTTGWASLNASMVKYFMKDKDFVKKLIRQWKKMRMTVITDEKILAIIDGEVAKLDNDALRRSLEKWPNQWDGSYLWANPSGNQYSSTYKQEIKFMREFVIKRARWIDENIGLLLEK